MKFSVDVLEHEIKLYFNDKVYDPHYSSIEPILIADNLIRSVGTEHLAIHDVACGSGLTAITLKKLHPDASVSMSDISPEAVRIAKLNAKRNGTPIIAYWNDLLEGKERYDIVMANLPTFGDKDMDLALHGPKEAYYGGRDPLALYDRLFKQAKHKCDVIICECQKKYQKPFLKLAERHGFTLMFQTDMAFAFLTDSAAVPQSSGGTGLSGEVARPEDVER